MSDISSGNCMSIHICTSRNYWMSLDPYKANVQKKGWQEILINPAAAGQAINGVTIIP